MKTIVRIVLFVDQRLWKAIFKVETPLYKIWWDLHCKKIQSELNEARKYDSFVL